MLLDPNQTVVKPRTGSPPGPGLVYSKESSWARGNRSEQVKPVEPVMAVLEIRKAVRLGLGNFFLFFILAISTSFVFLSVLLPGVVFGIEITSRIHIRE